MNRAVSLALTPLSVIYGIAVRLRNHLYRRGVLKTLDSGAPVLSVGNLTTGGTGKTPLVEFIAAQMAAQGYRVCVLTRGYRRKSVGRIVVSDYQHILADVNEAGDEPFLLAERLRGLAAVICDHNRVSAAQWAINTLGSDLFILDDAFQHQRIKRDLNILTIDATNAWGNRKMLPAGILREPIKEITRADCIVITRANESQDVGQLRKALARLSPNTRIFTSHTVELAVRPLNSTKQSIERLTDHDSPVAAFCGIGNPDSFFSLLRRQHYRLTYTRAFPDHKDYRQTDIDRFMRESLARGVKAVLTTAKDAVKLRSFSFDLPLYVIDVAIEIEGAQDFVEYVNHAIGAARCKTQ